jgi:major membrane immunogen (membrane-anchored lipoprotein)
MALVIGACSGDDAASTTTIDTADLTGVWKTPDDFYLVLANDGTYQAMTDAPDADSDTNDQFEWGTYTITDTTLVFVVAEDSVLFTGCKVRDDNGEWVGIDGTYQIEAIADDGQTWTTILVDDACDGRARDYTGQFTKHTS